MSRNNFNKKGQVGETMTWVIATILLIVILFIFIYASTLMAKTKNIHINFKLGQGISSDRIDIKTQMALSLIPSNKNTIERWISQEGADENG